MQIIPLTVKIIWNPPIKWLNFSQITGVFWQLRCMVLFCIRNGNFTYVLYPQNKKKSQTCSKFHEILQSTDGNFFKKAEKFLPIIQKCSPRCLNFLRLWMIFFLSTGCTEYFYSCCCSEFNFTNPKNLTNHSNIEREVK